MYCQAGNQFKVPDIQRCYPVSELKGRYSGNQILERDRLTSILLFCIDPGRSSGNVESERVGRHRGKQVIEKTPSPICLNRIFGAPNSMLQFHNTHG